MIDLLKNQYNYRGFLNFKSIEFRFYHEFIIFINTIYKADNNLLKTLSFEEDSELGEKIDFYYLSESELGFADFSLSNYKDKIFAYWSHSENKGEVFGQMDGVLKLENNQLLIYDACKTQWLSLGKDGIINIIINSMHLDVLSEIKVIVDDGDLDEYEKIKIIKNMVYNSINWMKRDEI